MISAERIPNNVGLSSNKRLQRALEHWQPAYIQWWRDMGPQGFQDLHQVYVRTAVSVDPSGWAHFEYVKLPEYRWGSSWPIPCTIAGLASVTSTGKMSGRKCRGSFEISCAGSS